MRETIEDRRNKGWGKVSDISGILSEMPDTRKVEIGLRMRVAKLINGMIYSTEAWSKISDWELVRLEQVNMSPIADRGAFQNQEGLCTFRIWYPKN